MKPVVLFVVASVAALTFGGCGSIYSPTLNLPHEPLQKNQGQMTGAASGLPQIGTDNVGLTFSGEGQIAYGFSDHVSLQGKIWSQLSEIYQGKFQGGNSLGATILLNDRADNIPLALVPNVSMLIEGTSINAYGASAQLAAWLPAYGIVRPYVAAGPGLLAKTFNDNNWGYGLVLNAGVSVTLSRNLRANAELFGAVERYLQNPKVDWYVSPSFSMSWCFEN